tara:strand:- start:61 stop:381 length:321 start_codon:yes stop_codon:yes gene_type:complete
MGMGLALILCGCIFGYALYRERSILLEIRDELYHIASSRSEFEKHLIREESGNDPAVVENIDHIVCMEDALKSDVVLELSFELQNIGLIKKSSFCVSLVLLACFIF